MFPTASGCHASEKRQITPCEGKTAKEHLEHRELAQVEEAENESQDVGFNNKQKDRL